MKAGKDSEEPIEAGNLVEQHRQGNHFSTSTETHDVKESLQASVGAMAVILEILTCGRGMRIHLDRNDMVVMFVEDFLLEVRRESWFVLLTRKMFDEMKLVRSGASDLSEEAAIVTGKVNFKVPP